MVIEPFFVANHGVNLATPVPKQCAMVFGAGAVGLGALCNLRAKSVEEVIVSDVIPSKLAAVE